MASPVLRNTLAEQRGFSPKPPLLQVGQSPEGFSEGDGRVLKKSNENYPFRPVGVWGDPQSDWRRVGNPFCCRDTFGDG